jgi:hypothetical protein
MDLLAGKASLSPEMALRLEAFGPDMNTFFGCSEVRVAQTHPPCQKLSIKRYVAA